MTATTFDQTEPVMRDDSDFADVSGESDSGLLRLLPFLIMLYSVCLPQEVRLTVAGLAIYPYRMAAFVLMPWLLSQLLKGRLRLNLIDMLVLAGALWMQISFVVFYGAGEGLVRGGALLIDILPPYFVARIAISSPLDLRRALVLAIPALAFVGGTMLLESVLGHALVRPTVATVFGPLSSYENGVEAGLSDATFDYRLGMLRAAGPFPHPILAGLFLASFIPLIVQSGLRHWPLYLGLFGSLCAVFSVSSAVWFSLAITCALVVYDWLQNRVEILNWMRALLLGGIGLLAIQAVSQSGLIALFIRYSLNPGTGYYRKLIWDYGVRSVERHPWFGIGYTDYERVSWMNNSVDNYWLLLAIRHGLLPSLLFLLASIIVIARLSLTSLSLPDPERRLFVGIAIAASMLVLAGFTVALGGGMQSWFFMVLAMGAGLGFAVPLAGSNPLSRRIE